MYYLRTKPAANAIQFTVDKSKLKEVSTAESGIENNGKSKDSPAEETDGKAKKLENMATLVCSINNKEDCLMCGS